MIEISRKPLLLKPSSKARRRRGNKFKYNEEHIVKTLWEMQHEKCCYCENKIPLKGHSKAVEHFVPKAKVKEFTNDWDNLLLACAQCNGKKSDSFPLELFKVDNTKSQVIYLRNKRDFKKGSPLLINPTKENPEKHLEFLCDIKEEYYGQITTKNNSNKGKYSIKTIGLYDTYYTNIHRDFIRQLVARYSMLTDAIDNGDSDGIQTEIQYFNQHMKNNYKLAGLARSFVKHYKMSSRYKQYGIKIPN
jgi:uncharacterized protein (TIGR02646 family)